MTALPPNPFTPEEDQFIQRWAYDICLQLEERHNNVKVSPDCKLTVLVAARFLGYMILEAPVAEGQVTFAGEIGKCENDASLLSLAELYKNHFLRLFHKVKGQTPTPSLHPSAPSFDASKGIFAEELTETPTSHAKAKELALVRDDYRCMVTGKRDIASYQAKKFTLGNSDQMGVTHLAHIFARSTMENINDEAKRNYAASAAAVLDRFGKLDFIEELNGGKIHRLENAMTLSTDIHHCFDTLFLWFERDDNMPINTYNLVSRDPCYLAALRLPSTVTFTTHDPTNFPLPDPRYLRGHAACAKVAHLSGAGEYIMKVLRDMENVDLLTTDGGVDALHHALLLYRTDEDVEAF